MSSRYRSYPRTVLQRKDYVQLVKKPLDEYYTADVPLIQRLLDGEDPNGIDRYDIPYLFRVYSEEAIRMYLQAGANIFEHRGNTILHYPKNLGAMRLLIEEYGVDPHKFNLNKQNSLVCQRDVDTMMYLVEVHNVDPRNEDDNDFEYLDEDAYFDVIIDREYEIGSYASFLRSTVISPNISPRVRYQIVDYITSVYPIPRYNGTEIDDFLQAGVLSVRQYIERMLKRPSGDANIASRVINSVKDLIKIYSVDHPIDPLQHRVYTFNRGIIGFAEKHRGFIKLFARLIDLLEQEIKPFGRLNKQRRYQVKALMQQAKGVVERIEYILEKLFNIDSFERAFQNSYTQEKIDLEIEKTWANLRGFEKSLEDLIDMALRVEVNVYLGIS